MSKYVVHKISFYYTDESYDVADDKGEILGVFETLEAAKKAKEEKDIYVLTKLAGSGVEDFIFGGDNYDEKREKLNIYYQSEFGLDISNEDYVEFPKPLSEVQAKQLLDIIDFTFHNIVEYSDDTEINEADFQYYDEDGDTFYLGE
jgi:hypothetical protein